MALLSARAMEIAIPVCAVIGIAFSLVAWWLGSRNADNRDDKKQDPTNKIAGEQKHKEITEFVSKGVEIFQFRWYYYVGYFLVAFAILIVIILGSLGSFSTQSWPRKSDPSNKGRPAPSAYFTAVSFLLGVVISALSGFIGMKIAIPAKGRTALEESLNGRISVAALWSGAVMGFFPASIGLLGLYLVIFLFKWCYGNDWEGLFEAITGYGLGGSSMALFLRASGGIYAKAADVCLHLVKDQFRQPDKNPAVITNYVGDIVGDIAGGGSDFFGSYAEPSYIALVVASVSSFGIKHDFSTIYYPLFISSMGILVGIFVCAVAIPMEKNPTLRKNISTHIEKIPISILREKIKLALKKARLIISTILMTAGIVVSLFVLPPEVVPQKVVKNWELSLCVAVGLWTGLIIEFVYVYDARRCDLTFSDASNVSVDLGSVRIPLFVAFILSVSSYFGATYGIAAAALGMLSTISTRLAEDAYDRIIYNAKRIAQMAHRETCDDNPTADITRRFAIESAALVSIALFGAFVSRLTASSPADVLRPMVVIGSGIGAWLPSYFSTMTMERVGRAGLDMARLIGIDKSTNYDKCVDFATTASFNGMMGPSALVMLVPLIVGTVFGVEMLSGLLAGALGSVVQLSISASKAGGAWNQAKEDFRAAGALEYARTTSLNSNKKAKITGHLRKHTSCTALNILVQLMAFESLVLAPWFASYGGLLFKYI